MFWLGIVMGAFLAAAVAFPLARRHARTQTQRARDAERRARNAQRLAEIGAMTGGLAHEIKNPLSTIGLNAQLLAEGISDLDVDAHDKGRLVRRIDSLRREVERLRDTLADFLKFAGNLRLEPRPADVNAVVEELADFYMPQAAHRRINLRTDLAPGPLGAMIDPPHLKQALLNLLINATQAIEDADRNDPDPSRPRELLLKTSIPKPAHRDDTPMVHLHVIDTGPGLTPETLEHIFTPYFTTKSGGSGLGLPTARRIIEEHLGSIHVDTEPGKGSDFRISLPRAALTPSAAPTPSASLASSPATDQPPPIAKP